MAAEGGSQALADLGGGLLRPSAVVPISAVLLPDACRGFEKVLPYGASFAISGDQPVAAD